MVSLSRNNGLDYGQDYTFTFKLSAYGVPVSLDEIIQQLSQLQSLQGVSVTESNTGAMGLTLAGGDWDVNFTFVGDDSVETVGSIADQISQAVSSLHWFTSFDLVQAVTGDIGLVTSGQADQGLTGIEKSFGDISKNLLYIGIALVLVVVAIKFA